MRDFFKSKYILLVYIYIYVLYIIAQNKLLSILFDIKVSLDLK